MIDTPDLTLSVEFPGDLDYVPDVRRFLSNVISLRAFSRRFAFRMEIIIDELCNNAVKFGRLKVGEFVRIGCRIEPDGVTLDVFNPGADAKEIARLRKAVLASAQDSECEDDPLPGRGIQIIKILATSIQVPESEGTLVRVIKKKNDAEDL